MALANRSGSDEQTCSWHVLSALEVLEVPARSRSALTLILRTSRALAVGIVCWRRHRHEAHLTNLHLWIQRDRQIRHVRQLQRDVPIESSIDEPRSRVNQESQSAERALSLHTSDEVISDRDSLERGSEDKLAGVQHEGIIGPDLDQFGQFGQVLLHVDDGGRVIAKDAEQVRDLDVDRRWLQTRLIKGVDHDSACREGLTDTAV